MKPADVVKLVLINVLLVACILSPFLPGPANDLVIGWSLVGQFAGFLGPVLMLVAFTWNNRALRIPACMVIAFASCIFILFTIAITMQNGWATGITMLITGLLLVFCFNQHKWKRTYLFSIAVTAFLTTWFVLPSASNCSRDLAIRQCEDLVAMIEHHRSVTGSYPQQLKELFANRRVPAPSVMGVKDYRYNLINDQYSLSFSQWLELGSLEQIVLYDKYDLRNNLPPERARYDYSFDLCRVKGAFASHDTRYKDWRYYQVD